MTTLKEIRESARATARQVKEAAVENATTREGTFIRPSVLGYRGNEPVILLISEQVDRDQGLAAVRLAAMGFGCDAVALVTDSWHASTMTNPLTGKVWGPGEMQVAVEQHDGIERGWITEDLTTLVVNRAGDQSFGMDGFRIEQVGYGARTRHFRIEWVPTEWDGVEADKLDGKVPNALVRAMMETPLDVLAAKAGLSPADFDLDHVEGRAHMDCAVVRVMNATGIWAGAAVLMSNDPTRSEIIDESLSQLPGAMWEKGGHS